MIGTFGGALEARKIDASSGRLTCIVRGEVENVDGVLVLKRIHVEHHLAASAEARETVERVHGFYAQKCPVYRSLSGSIEITSSFVLEQSP